MCLLADVMAIPLWSPTHSAFAHNVISCYIKPLSLCLRQHFIWFQAQSYQSMMPWKTVGIQHKDWSSPTKKSLLQDLLQNEIATFWRHFTRWTELQVASWNWCNGKTESASLHCIKATKENDQHIEQLLLRGQRSQSPQLNWKQWRTSLHL